MLKRVPKGLSLDWVFSEIEERCSQPRESLSDCGMMEYGGLFTSSAQQWFFNTKSQQCEHDPNSCDYSDSTFFGKSECEMACEGESTGTIYLINKSQYVHSGKQVKQKQEFTKCMQFIPNKRKAIVI